METTLIIIKPDAVKGKKIGKIISIYEENGLAMEMMKLEVPTLSTLQKHYEEHREKSFFNSLVSFMSSGLALIMVASGENAVAKVRALNGATNPENAGEGTIRKLYGHSVQENAVHGSATIEEAKREIKIWFE